MALTFLALNRISSFNENEERAFIILNRTQYRKDSNHVCQRIIHLNYEIYKLKKSRNKKDILSNSKYSGLNHRLKIESWNKLEIIKNLQNDFITDNDKIKELENNIDKNIKDLKKDLSFFEEIPIKLKRQKINQVMLMENIENTLKLTRDQ